MHPAFVILYFVCFAVITGGAFALMWYNMKTIYWGARPRKHPEAPLPGEQVMYVDLEKEKLEKLYEDN